MPCVIPTAICANQKGERTITNAFTDSNDDPVTPSAASWRLVDASGNVINSRSNVPITSLSTSVDVVLQGDDLPWNGDEYGGSYSIYYHLSFTYTDTDLVEKTQKEEMEIQIRQLFGTS